MLHKEFWGLLFLGFVVWIFMASDGTTRINRGCRPIAWGGNVVVSLTALALPAQQGSVKKWVDKVEYGCRYSAWRLFYQDDYNRFLEQQQQATGKPAPSSVPAAEAEPSETPSPPVTPLSSTARE